MKRRDTAPIPTQVVIGALCACLVAAMGLAASTSARAQTPGEESVPSELWKTYPLEPRGGDTRIRREEAREPQPAPAPSPADTLGTPPSRARDVANAEQPPATVADRGSPVVGPLTPVVLVLLGLLGLLALVLGGLSLVRVVPSGQRPLARARFALASPLRGASGASSRVGHRRPSIPARAGASWAVVPVGGSRLQRLASHWPRVSSWSAAAAAHRAGLAVVPRVLWRVFLRAVVAAGVVPRVLWRVLSRAVVAAAVVPRVLWRVLLRAVVAAGVVPRVLWRVLSRAVVAAAVVPRVSWRVLSGAVVAAAVVPRVSWHVLSRAAAIAVAVPLYALRLVFSWRHQIALYGLVALGSAVLGMAIVFLIG